MRKVPTEAIGVNQTIAQKINNFWFYNKWKVLFSAILSFIIAISVYSCCSKPNYDCTVVMALSTELTDASITALREELTNYCEDYNGDGEVLLNVYNCCFTNNAEGIGNSVNSHYVNFVSSFQQSENMIYIIDQNKIDFIDDNSVMDSSLSLPDLNGCGYKLNGTEFENTCKEKTYFSLPEDTYIIRRSYTGTITKKKDAKEHFDNAGKFIKTFVNIIQ